MEIIEILLSASFWGAVLRIASPLIFATMGELICERAGVLNLGIEGIMVIGAFAGWMAVYAGFGLWPGVLIAMISGMLLTWHNLHYFQEIMQGMRDAIATSSFDVWQAEFHAQRAQGDIDPV